MTVRWLVEQDANPNLLKYEGKTPLNLAVGSENQEIAELLRASGGIE